MARARKKPSLQSLVDEYLTELANANRSAETCRAYGTDLRQFVGFHQGTIEDITPDVLRAFGTRQSHLAPSTRARKQAALSSFLIWATRVDKIESNPMLKVTRVRRDPARPRSLPRERIELVLAAIPSAQRRDRLLFRLLFETGLRVSEALWLYVEDLDLARDDEHIVVKAKGNRRRTVLLDDPHLVKALRAYLKDTGYQYGPLFRASKNGRGGPLRYQSVHYRWQRYCARAGVQCTIHQLRHSHATEMVNDGVSLATIRKRLGHQSIQTTLLYAEKTDATADAEIRAWRRKRLRKR